jgi:hypothetical protein
MASSLSGRNPPSRLGLIYELRPGWVEGWQKCTVVGTRPRFDVGQKGSTTGNISDQDSKPNPNRPPSNSIPTGETRLRLEGHNYRYDLEPVPAVIADIEWVLKRITTNQLETGTAILGYFGLRSLETLVSKSEFLPLEIAAICGTKSPGLNSELGPFTR